MKNITLFLLATLIFTACTTPFESFGEFSRKQLQNSEHNRWYMDNYEAHPINETSVSQNIDKGKHVTPPNLFLKETNMTLDLEQECEQKPAITASQ